MDNKKNTVLLTVIAVATLLVAVVGATFAYFTAQGGTGSTANVTVTTGTAASSQFGSFGAINIYADATTFSDTGEWAGTADGERTKHTGTSTGNVSWTAPGATANTTPSEADRTFCYTAMLNITANNFEVSADNTEGKAELEFTAVKTPYNDTENPVTIIDKMDITTTDTDVKIPTTVGGSDYTHKIIAEAGQTKADDWSLTVTLVNYNFNQNENTGKNFTGVIKFDKVDCQ